MEGCFAMAGVGFLHRLCEKPIWQGVWPYLDPMDGVCLRTASVEWNVSGKYGPHGELFFFLIQKDFCSADVLKQCALIALHLSAEEGRGGEDGCHVPNLGDEWKEDCPRSPMWESEGEGSTWATKQCTSLGCMDLVTRSLSSCRIGSWQRWH